jgi:uncharacterized Rmd1/YagE family protein
MSYIIFLLATYATQQSNAFGLMRRPHFVPSMHESLHFRLLASDLGNIGKEPKSSSSSSSSSLSGKRMGNVQVQTEAMKARNNASSRRKMGPPQRKRNSKDDAKLSAGRVSVYCVGSSIDLQTLRAHVFRRAFNNANSPELTLARRAEEPEIDDEVLHVSNAPLFIDSNSNGLPTAWRNFNDIWDEEQAHGGGTHNVAKGTVKASSNKMSAVDNRVDSSDNTTINLDDDAVHTLQPVEKDSRDWEQLSWKTKEQLIMCTQDVFYFEYGCVVFWGLTSLEEKAALTELEAFTIQPVSRVELENSFDTMEFVFDRSVNPQRPVRFDRMKLRSLRVEEKLALSYAMAQSSKLFVFEQKVLQSVERTRYLPKELAEQGKISCSKKDLNRLIGQLFVEQTEVNLFSSILDTPDFLWDDDEYVPVYEYTRSYLEVDDRVELLNSRLSVIRELLDVLTAQVADNNSTRLEWIVIWLIAIEIVMGIASGPLSVGKRMIGALLVPTAIIMYKKFDKSWQ